MCTEERAVAQTKEREEEDKRNKITKHRCLIMRISRGKRFFGVKKSSSPRDVTLQPKGHKLVRKVSADWQPQLLQIQK